MISVVIADGQPLFRDAVARVIRQDAALQLAAELADGRAVLAAIRRDAPTVAVIARDLAELDGER
ncbi:MAG TPA: DNA-binding response regulator, partial [Thermoanaerobaculia bacterium]